ncbi:flagellar basal body P-ring protein FlgI [Vibrio cincinnatiensis]|uniref:flagellar basal body P-ring protein FlgI n=1 Tax=Vibrio cincinnatiensis TaxID=675 RepID=UPI001EDFCA49|nr:flagellar basal body P-ring protein FlgI [Vibrio cincinnatiensis]
MHRQIWAVLLLMLAVVGSVEAFSGIKVGALTRVEGVRDNELVGYGIVVGLSGTGDSRRSQATLQSVANTLQKFGVSVSASELSSRNVAAVMVTATIPAFSEKGNRIDVKVSSIGDSRSLVGGTLLLTPLNTVNGKVIAVAQGAVSVGGYSFDAFGNKVQKNHPTSGIVSKGAVVEYSTTDTVIQTDGSFTLLLKEPDFNMSSKISDTINTRFKSVTAEAIHAGKIRILLGQNSGASAYRKIGQIQNLTVVPETIARIVINERTGTIVAGGTVQIDNVTITHGDLKIRIDTNYLVSQPNSVLLYDRWNIPVEGDRNNGNIRTTVVPDTNIQVQESGNKGVTLGQGARVSDLISALNDMKLSTRDIITILQSISRAGALHGELIVE